ncbi:unnamed protein product [Phytophthora lilii]|uniref:Unnamed protein product n=1 Tax=Phytophthora lilii TaxID=2077276 RepID=A0A9W6TJM0_9STRA|nr:unnamed protein product [Phytophthora lilii]
MNMQLSAVEPPPKLLSRSNWLSSSLLLAVQLAAALKRLVQQQAVAEPASRTTATFAECGADRSCSAATVPQNERMSISTGAMECAVVAFGCNDDGQLGTGAKRRPTLAIDDVSASNFPKQLGGLLGEEVVAVSCGSRHTMALTAAGAVYSWGWGSMGQLGHGDLKSINVPQKIAFFEQEGLEVGYISCGGCHSAAVTNDGTLYMWGETHWGQLGLPKEFEAAHESLPVKCPLLEGDADESVVKISCGGTHTAALTNLGRVYVWGRGDSGQLGIGSAWLKDTEDEGLLGVSRPHLLEGFNGEKVVQVACGAFHSAAVTEQGHVYIWGKEDYGMLGVGQTSDQQTPKRVEFFDDIPALYVDFLPICFDVVRVFADVEPLF